MGLKSFYPDWIHDRGLRNLYLLLPIVLVSSSYQGFDGMIMNGLQLLPSWRAQFHNPQGPVLGLLNSIQPVGALVALPFITWVVDKWGRRWSIVFGASWTIIGAILQASSKEIPQFVIARFLIGWGLAYTVVGSPLLLVELALPKHRGSVISYFPTVWYIGAIVAAWTTFGTRKIENTWSWRIPSLLQGIPAIIQIVGIFFVPESPRWLISQGREAEAKAILVKHHANGVEGNPLVELEYNEIKEAIATDKGYKDRSNWFDLIRTAPNRRRIFITFFCGLFIEISGNGLVQYYLHSVLVSIGITSTATQTTINGCLSIYNFVVAVGASLFVERIGRRPLFIISTAGMLTAFILWTTFAARKSPRPLSFHQLHAIYTEHKTTNYAIGVLVSIFLSNGAYDIGWTPLYSYATELLPYEIRARGVTFQTGVLHAFGFFGTFVNPIGLKNIGWKYYIVYIVYTFIELSVVWYFFVETRGYTLEQISTIFETPGLTWKQRRNMRASNSLTDPSVTTESGDSTHKVAAAVSEKQIDSQEKF
ncbi:general substrate transporter [Lepidopterella palustris CBS 459.81]|uniref:General substrate transporter n=1 Tax=Lepidopterella palustris CBS 459.81 TaxID=1314670 RepID=A0A8E2E8U6_9PEZI|nr:general substrate transporter [Lepidopterella palustris CBS 459.81]